MNELVERYTHQLEQNPGNHLARYSLAKAHFDAGQFAAAREHFTKALEAKGDWMMAAILLGKTHLALGDRDAARESFRKALELAIAQDHDGPREEMEQLLHELQS